METLVTLIPPLWVCVLVTSGVYFAGVVVHRVFLSPLAKFPGPKLAAASVLYEFYYDIICKGQYTFKIKQLHDEYGSIQTDLKIYVPRLIHQQAQLSASAQMSCTLMTSTSSIPSTQTKSR
jgi:hypothetical protein